MGGIALRGGPQPQRFEPNARAFQPSPGKRNREQEEKLHGRASPGASFYGRATPVRQGCHRKRNKETRLQTSARRRIRFVTTSITQEQMLQRNSTNKQQEHSGAYATNKPPSPPPCLSNPPSFFRPLRMRRRRELSSWSWLSSGGRRESR